MSVKRKSYSPEFKSKIALSAIREEASLTELSSRFGINVNMISKWKKQALEGFKDIFAGKLERQAKSEDARIKELHAKIGELTVEKDFLQTASNLFVGGIGK